VAAVGSGQLVGLAVTSKTRVGAAPNVPTMVESGFPGFEMVVYTGILAPAGTPRPIIDKLNAALRRLVETDEVKKRIYFEGGDPLTSSPDEYAADIDREETKWSTLIRKLNLKVE
jgi:tripartite-type tricarboxylate transporter receptor subunit TctC